MGGDNGVYDGDWESFDDEEIDQVLRQRFDRAFPIHDTSLEVLSDIRPAVGKARRRYAARRAASWSVAASLFVAAGVLALEGFVPAGEAIIAVEPAESSQADGADGSDVVSALPLPTPVVQAADSDDRGENEAGASSKMGDAPSTTTPSSNEVSSSAVSSDEQVTGSTTGTTVPPPPTPTTTTASTTSQATTGTTLQGPCGYLVYEDKGHKNLELVEVISIFEVKIKEDGPEVIKVAFEGAGDRCDLEVKYVDGEVETFVGDDD